MSMIFIAAAETFRYNLTALKGGANDEPSAATGGDSDSAWRIYRRAVLFHSKDEKKIRTAPAAAQEIFP